MAYRLHVQVYEARPGSRFPGPRLSVNRLRRELAGVIPSVGYAGTRRTDPGIWVERARIGSIQAAAQTLDNFARNTGYLMAFYATNAQTAAAVRGYVEVRRG